MEGCGKVDVKACELQLLVIAVDGSFDGDGMIRILSDKRWRHITQVFHQVLFAYLSIQSHSHHARILFIKGIEVHIYFSVDIRIGCSEAKSWYLDFVEGRIESDTAF